MWSTTESLKDPEWTCGFGMKQGMMVDVSLGNNNNIWNVGHCAVKVLDKT